jgi:hypothetical protein
MPVRRCPTELAGTNQAMSNRAARARPKALTGREFDAMAKVIRTGKAEVHKPATRQDPPMRWWKTWSSAWR